MGDELDEGERADVRHAYDRLISAFADAATEDYFACFDDDATFFFPGEGLLEGRSAYEAAWKRWHDEGVRFTNVVARDVRIGIVGTTAVVTHRIETTVESDGTTTVDHERETIVFTLEGGRWVAIHEHLSPDE